MDTPVLPSSSKWREGIFPELPLQTKSSTWGTNPTLHPKNVVSNDLIRLYEQDRLLDGKRAVPLMGTTPIVDRHFTLDTSALLNAIAQPEQFVKCGRGGEAKRR